VASAGLAEQVAARPTRAARRRGDPGVPRRLIESLRPRPDHPPVLDLRYPALGRLVGASVPSLRRYAGEDRRTPDAVAQRVHLVALLTAILRGSFNEFGIRRWFERPHPALGGRVPGDLVARASDPADRDARSVLGAALSLLG
jgi:hypothetical protein